MEDSSKKSVSGPDKPPKPDVRLQSCYFLMGMGLLAACCSMWQCMDYMAAVFPGLYPQRVLQTCYNLLNMVVVFCLFFGGPRLWPSKRSRMLTGYCMYVFALAMPPLVDMLAHRFAPAHRDLGGVLAAWAVGTAVSGAADAIVSSVIYGEAAVLGPGYTHAFLAGKAACGLTLALIRCASKAALPGKQVHTLQLATSIFLATGVLLVALCVFIVALVLPRLQAAVGMWEGPATLTVQQTLLANEAITLGHPVPPTASLLPQSNSLMGMVSGMSGALLSPAFAVSTKASSKGSRPRVVLSRVDTSVALQGQHTSRLLSPFGTTTLPLWSTADHTTSVRSSTDKTPTCSSSIMPPGGSSTISGSKAVSFQLVASAVPSDAASHGRGSDQPPRGRPSSQRTSWEGQGHVVLGPAALSGMQPAASVGAGASRGSAVHASSAQKLQQLPAPAPGVNPFLRDSIGMAPDSPASVDAWACGLDEDLLHHQSPFSVSQTPLKLHPAAGSGDLRGTTEVDQEEGVSSDQGPSLMEAIRGVWLTMRQVYAYQTAVAVPCIVTSAVQAMLFSQDFSQTVIGTWYVQIMAVTYQLGGFVGSGLIPIPASLRRPKPTLLGASVAMLVFVGAFVALLKLNGGPFAFLVAAFFMYLYSGYLIACSFCLAGQGLLADDAQMVQMVLVLSIAVAYVLGGSVSWVWIAIPKS